MRAEDRLPRTEWPPADIDSLPSQTRPFGLRVARRALNAPTVRHRTDPHKTPQENTTNLDNKEVKDTYTTPDD